MKNLNYLESIKTFAITYSTNIITAAVILLVGLWLSKFLSRTLRKILESRKVEITLVEFLEDLTFWTFRGLVFIAVISELGVETSSFVAILGAAGLAVGLSLQGSLANFAGGILIILFKPFKVGDKIDVQGEIGKVEDIQIFSTKIITSNNHVVYIPNGMLSNGKIKNFSQRKIVRTDFEVNFAKEENINQIKSKTEQLLLGNSLILKDQKPEVFISAVNEENFTVLIRFWSDSDNSIKIKSELLSAINS
ncbi:mechanosensitive ion channel family protein [Flavobacterium sp. H122]|uniref:mechanosensitive ion channel family protein n=1 Tax=Flavobacterium sp. H122 TaxID=2529860 RepID=UPI0010AA7069|nr:mechanosensitive ion channel domain-containing protein [Flavobacterium sp. H122]